MYEAIMDAILILQKRQKEEMPSFSASLWTLGIDSSPFEGRGKGGRGRGFGNLNAQGAGIAQIDSEYENNASFCLQLLLHLR